MSAPAPIRFLVLVGMARFGGRAIVFLPTWWSGPYAPVQAAKLPQAPPPKALPPAPWQKLASARPRIGDVATKHPAHPTLIAAGANSRPPPDPQFSLPAPPDAPARPSLTGPPAHAAALLPPPLAYSPRAPEGRWSATAWALVRRDGPAPLAAGGQLGGSQVGARIAYRVNADAARPLSLVARASSPLRDLAQADAALGVEWQPLESLPVRLLAERRQALGPRGRSDFALIAHGGVSGEKIGPLRLDAYAQAGAVGTASPDLFADGAAAFRLPVDRSGRLQLGAGAWAAAQPGVTRIDVGPQVGASLPVAGRTLTLRVDWRFRVAGNAAPVSGPALTIASDF